MQPEVIVLELNIYNAEKQTKLHNLVKTLFYVMNLISSFQKIDRF
jgi:hypothetical protein